VRALLLEQGAVNEAALAAIETLELYLLEGRDLQVPSLTATPADLFRDAGAPVNAMKPLAHPRSRARAGRLTHGDVVAVRTFFEKPPHRPNARFRRP